MEKPLFYLKCKSPMNKTKPLASDMLTTQKVLVNQLQSFQNKNRDKIFLFNQWECKCGNRIITI